MAAPARYKRPESVLLVVYTAADEVLLLRRVRPSTFWQSVTGSLKWGESPLDAAHRELFEETGLRVSRARLVDWRHQERFPIRAPWRERYAPATRFNREHWFRLRLDFRRRVRLDPGEHLELRWLPREQAARRVTSWTNRKAIRALPLPPARSPPEPG